MADYDTCVICGAPVPEGHMVCWICAHGGLGPQEEEQECEGGCCTIGQPEDTE